MTVRLPLDRKYWRDESLKDAMTEVLEPYISNYEGRWLDMYERILIEFPEKPDWAKRYTYDEFIQETLAGRMMADFYDAIRDDRVSEAVSSVVYTAVFAVDWEKLAGNVIEYHPHEIDAPSRWRRVDSTDPIKSLSRRRKK